MKLADTSAGGLFCDDRGILRYMNEVDFSEVRRFYQVENHEQGFLRCWHGHRHEAKYVWVAKGSALVAHIDMATADRWGGPTHCSEQPGYTSPLDSFVRVVLSDKQPRLLYIPPGQYNGFLTLEEDTRVIFFSTSTIQESADDDIRLPANHLGSQVWEIVPR